MPKCIGTFDAVGLWLGIIIIIWLLVPSTYENIHNYGSTVSGVFIAGWWLMGYFIDCYDE
jgi:hypothetical protein